MSLPERTGKPKAIRGRAQVGRESCRNGTLRKFVTGAGQIFSCYCAAAYRATIRKTCTAKQIAIDSSVNWTNNFITLIYYDAADKSRQFLGRSNTGGGHAYKRPWFEFRAIAPV
jgi:hypothetical protein